RSSDAPADRATIAPSPRKLRPRRLEVRDRLADPLVQRSRRLPPGCLLEQRGVEAGAQLLAGLRGSMSRWARRAGGPSDGVVEAGDGRLDARPDVVGTGKVLLEREQVCPNDVAHEDEVARLVPGAVDLRNLTGEEPA